MRALSPLHAIFTRTTESKVFSVAAYLLFGALWSTAASWWAPSTQMPTYRAYLWCAHHINSSLSFYNDSEYAFTWCDRNFDVGSAAKQEFLGIRPMVVGSTVFSALCRAFFESMTSPSPPPIIFNQSSNALRLLNYSKLTQIPLNMPKLWVRRTKSGYSRTYIVVHTGRLLVTYKTIALFLAKSS